MLTSERKRVVLDTSVILRGLMAKKMGKKDSFCYKIIRQFESNHFKLIMNSRIKEEYERKLNEHVKNGTVAPSDVSNFMSLVVSDKAQYDRMFVTPPVDVVDDPTDNIFLLSNNCLQANYLVTENSKHLNNTIREDLKKLRSGLQIVSPTEFLGEQVKAKIYVGHSTAFNYQDELYTVLRSSALNEKYNFILPHEQSLKLFSSRTVIPTCDFVLAEVSYPSTGLGIELGWANMEHVPILCMYKSGNFFSSSLKAVCNVFFEYDSNEEVITQLTDILAKISSGYCEK